MFIGRNHNFILGLEQHAHYALPIDEYMLV